MNQQAGLKEGDCVLVFLSTVDVVFHRSTGSERNILARGVIESISIDGMATVECDCVLDITLAAVLVVVDGIRVTAPLTYMVLAEQ